MRCKFSLAVMAALLLLTCQANADTSSTATVVQSIPPGDDKITPLRKGDPVPYDGQLFDNATALRWGNWLLQYKLRLDLDVGYEQKLRQADVSLWTQKYDISEKKYETVTADYQRKVAALEGQVVQYRMEVQNPPWYRSPLFGFTVGIVFTGLCVGVGAYALNTTTK